MIARYVLTQPTSWMLWTGTNVDDPFSLTYPKNSSGITAAGWAFVPREGSCTSITTIDVYAIKWRNTGSTVPSLVARLQGLVVPRPDRGSATLMPNLLTDTVLATYTCLDLC